MTNTQTIKSFMVKEYSDCQVTVPASIAELEMTGQRTTFVQAVIEDTKTYLSNKLWTPLMLLLAMMLINPIKNIVESSKNAIVITFTFLGRTVTRVINSARPLNGAVRIADMQAFASGNIEMSRLATMLGIPLEKFSAIQINEVYYASTVGHLKKYLTGLGIDVNNEVANYWVHGAGVLLAILPGMSMDEATKIIGEIGMNLERVNNTTAATAPSIGTKKELDVGGTTVSLFECGGTPISDRELVTTGK